MMNTKDRVAALLAGAKGCVSGEEMSAKLGVSRAAVNAAVQLLRKDGYQIGSSTKKGYTLERSPDALSAGELAARLGEARMETVECFDSLGSTNDLLKRLAASGAPEGAVVVANEQTAGRGRLGRSFMSPKNSGIYLSMALRPDCAPSDAANLTAWVAVAICRALAGCGVDAGIKWVNDIVCGGKKVGGILTEMAVESESGRVQYVVTGIGINVSQTAEDFPFELRDIAASLRMAGAGSVDRNELAANMIRELDALRASWPDGKIGYLEEYRSRCVNIGREVVFTRDGTQYAGTASGVDGEFGLAVDTDSGPLTLRSGEVSVRGMYGYV